MCSASMPVTGIPVWAGLLRADKRGAFVQPALYEAFGLTVIEAMSCGLPTFATMRGGPAEVTATPND